MKFFLPFAFFLLDVVTLNVVVFVDGHGTMIKPPPRQPESLYWYQVGCMIGCTCSGGGKETYPSLESVNCKNPIEPTNTDVNGLTWNADFQSPRNDWNRYMPWRAPGSAIPLDACGIASGFLPTATVQFPHEFSSSIQQGTKGTQLPSGQITTWKVNSIVEASFSLSVNHGGGYQYRVCPKKSNNNSNNNDYLTNDCFEQNPLSFATDTHIVTLQGDDAAGGGGKQFEIPATDISVGVRPSGSSWRRLPLPACNCDMGSGCSVASNSDQYDSYNTNASTLKPHGHCTTGLQFEAPHLKSIWPDGYGYYVATLGGDKTNNAKCGGYTDVTSCHQATDCLWYVEKNICYETTKSKDTNLDNKDNNKNPNDDDPCPKQKDQASCVATVTDPQSSDTQHFCTWYESAYKKICYNGKQKSRHLKQKTENTDKNNYNVNWSITDKLRAPSVPGEYILQWRWDNEQTPQIWTTCADIQVTDGSTTNTSATHLLLNWSTFVSSLAMVATIATWSFW